MRHSLSTIYQFNYIIIPHVELESICLALQAYWNIAKTQVNPYAVLTQILLRGPSTLTEAERELIASVVSHGNQCKFCTAAHTAAVDMLLGENTTSEMVKTNILTAPVSEKMKVLLMIASLTGKSGRMVTPVLLNKLKRQVQQI